MKLLKIIITCLVAVAASYLYISCVKAAPELVSATEGDFTNKAFVQVYNASIPSASTDPRRNYIYVNGAPLTGAAVPYGSFFPAVGPGAAVISGFREFLIRDTLPAGTQPQLSFPETFQAAKNYTIFMYDSFNVIKQKTVETNIVIPTDTTSRVRFANFVYYPTIIPGIDIFSKNRNAYVVQNLLPTQVTDFIPYASAIGDSLFVTESGNPSNKLDTLAGFFPTRLRSYTLIFRGRWRTNEAASAPNPRVLTSFTNN
jgi:hypothetical protein